MRCDGRTPARPMPASAPNSNCRRTPLSIMKTNAHPCKTISATLWQKRIFTWHRPATRESTEHRASRPACVAGSALRSSLAGMSLVALLLPGSVLASGQTAPVYAWTNFAGQPQTS